MSTKIDAQFIIKWYTILKSALSLLKQTVLINMYVFIPSKDANSENLCTYGFPFSKCWPSKMTKTQNLDFPSSSFYFSQIYNIYL